MSRLLRWVAIGGLVLLAGIQLVPYGRSHTNPPVRGEPPWDSPATRTLAARACFDCHSNETAWPRYAQVAPASWLIQRDVDKGRRKLNFSEWGRRQKEARESAKTVRKGEMPPWLYTAIQSDARLLPAETEALIRGLGTTFGSERK